MGLKSGSRDAGLDGSDDEDGDEDGDTETTGGAGRETNADDGSGGTDEADAAPADRAPTREDVQNVPDTRGDESGSAREGTSAGSTSGSETERSAGSESRRSAGSASEPSSGSTSGSPRSTSESVGSSSDSTTRDSRADDGAERPPMDSIPYKLRRNKVNEGREQVPYFLRQEVVDAEDDLQDTLEARLGEDVYKSDYREASMVVAQRNPDLVAAVLREWGYDLDGS